MAETEEADAGLEAVLDEMRAAGMSGAVIRKDGAVAASSMALQNPALVSSLANVADMMLKKEGDTPREVEVVFSSLMLIIIPIKQYYFVAAIKDREQKKAARGFAEKAAGFL